MHELSFVQATLDIALAQAREAGASRIHAVAIRVGPLAGVVPEALSQAFEIVVEGTLAEGAELRVEEAPLVCWCAACAREFRVAALVFECPDCGQPSGDVRGGRELTLAYLEVS